jgi:hypothetical protein
MDHQSVSWNSRLRGGGSNVIPSREIIFTVPTVINIPVYVKVVQHTVNKAVVLNPRIIF